MRIFVAAIAQGELVVRGDEHHYLARVRRARVGDAIEIADGAMRARATIVKITDDATTLAVEAPEAIAAKLPFVRVVIPAIKGDRMDTCLEKLVEVGVDEIVIFPAQRAVVKLDDKRDAKLAKYRAALQAAARQSGSPIPTIQIAYSLADAIRVGSQLRVVLDPSSDAALTAGTVRDVTIVSGPEGGLAPNELETLLQAGFSATGLGPRVLRAETAPVIAVALIRHQTGS